MKRFTLIKKAPPVNYALESTRPPSGGRVSPYSGRRGRRPRRPVVGADDSVRPVCPLRSVGRDPCVPPRNVYLFPAGRCGHRPLRKPPGG